MPKIKLELSIKEFEKLHSIADTRTKQVTVPKSLLLKLLMDHSSLINHAGRDIIMDDCPKRKLKIKRNTK